MPQEFAEHPKDTFLRSIYVNPFWEDSIDALVDTIGADRVLFGSDYPHPEGLAEPLSWVDEISHRSDGEIHKIMGGNMFDLLGVRANA
jgi:predicted TIM-barrel fold metal-dependent hydrolase